MICGKAANLFTYKVNRAPGDIACTCAKLWQILVKASRPSLSSSTGPGHYGREGDHGRQSCNCTDATKHHVSHCSNNVRAARAKSSAANPCFVPRRSSRAVAACVSAVPACTEAAAISSKCSHLICRSALSAGVFAHACGRTYLGPPPETEILPKPFRLSAYNAVYFDLTEQNSKGYLGLDARLRTAANQAGVELTTVFLSHSSAVANSAAINVRSIKSRPKNANVTRVLMFSAVPC